MRQVELRGVVIREQTGRLAVLVDGTIPPPELSDRVRQVEVIGPSIGPSAIARLEARSASSSSPSGREPGPGCSAPPASSGLRCERLPRRRLRADSTVARRKAAVAARDVARSPSPARPLVGAGVGSAARSADRSGRRRRRRSWRGAAERLASSSAPAGVRQAASTAAASARPTTAATPRISRLPLRARARLRAGSGPARLAPAAPRRSGGSARDRL